MPILAFGGAILARENTRYLARDARALAMLALACSASVKPYRVIDGKKWTSRSREDEAGVEVTEYKDVLRGLALRATLRFKDPEGQAELTVHTIPPVTHDGLVTTLENSHPVDMHGNEEPARLTFIPEGINVR